MPSFFSGLLNAGTQAAEGYDQGQQELERKALIAAARQRQIARENAQDTMAQESHAAQMQAARDAALTGGIRRGGTHVTAATTSDTPVDPSHRTFDEVAQQLGGIGPTSARAPSALVRPVNVGTIPSLSVTQDPDTYDPNSDRAVVRQRAAIDERGAGAMERLITALKSKETEGAANRTSREVIAGDNRTSREAIAANRVAAQREVQGAMGTKPVTGTARLQHIRTLASAYMKPSELGGLGMSRAEAIRNATADVGAMISSGTTSTSAAPSPASPLLQDPGKVFDRVTPPAAGAAAPTASLPPLTPAQRARAAKDPGFAAFLKSKGY